MDHAKIMDTETLAKYLGVCQRTIVRQVEDGKFPEPFYIGRRRRWNRDVVDAWLASGGSKAGN